MSEAKIIIVILNWNGWRDTIECLESIFTINYPDCRIVVVDNGSNDGSVEEIKKRIGDKIDLLEMKDNLGFARANNIGIKYALPRYEAKYVIAMNNDIVVKEDFIGPLIKVLGDGRVGMAGPKSVNYYTGRNDQGVMRNRPGLIASALLFTPLRQFLFKNMVRKIMLIREGAPYRVYAIGGCCMAFRREALEKVNYFDENTFLGSEEYIMAEKMRRAGFSVYTVPESVVYHKVARDTARIGSFEKALSFLRSSIYYENEHLKYNFAQRTIMKMLRAVLYLFACVFIKEFRGKCGDFAGAIFK